MTKKPVPNDYAFYHAGCRQQFLRDTAYVGPGWNHIIVNPKRYYLHPNNDTKKAKFAKALYEHWFKHIVKFKSVLKQDVLGIYIDNKKDWSYAHFFLGLVRRVQSIEAEVGLDVKSWTMDQFIHACRIGHIGRRAATYTDTMGKMMALASGVTKPQYTYYATTDAISVTGPITMFSDVEEKLTSADKFWMQRHKQIKKSMKLIEKEVAK